MQVLAVSFFIPFTESAKAYWANLAVILINLQVDSLNSLALAGNAGEAPCGCFWSGAFRLRVDLTVVAVVNKLRRSLVGQNRPPAAALAKPKSASDGMQKPFSTFDGIFSLLSLICRDDV